MIAFLASVFIVFILSATFYFIFNLFSQKNVNEDENDTFI